MRTLKIGIRVVKGRDDNGAIASVVLVRWKCGQLGGLLWFAFQIMVDMGCSIVALSSHRRHCNLCLLDLISEHFHRLLCSRAMPSYLCTYCRPLLTGKRLIEV
jgi:hypothetical protein